MKKFFTALVSFLLAGTMAFSLAACKKNDNTDDSGGGTNNEQNNNNNENNNNENNNNNQNNNNQNNENVSKALLDAINATLAVENYKLTVGSTETYTVLFNGSKMTADTVLASIPNVGDFTGLDFYKMMMEDEELTAEDFENPVVNPGREYVYSFDFAGGKAKIEEDWGDDDVDIEYYEVDGATINNYYMNEYGTYNPDTDDYNYVTAPYKESYVGYADAAQAKQVLKKIMLSEIGGMTLEEVVSTKVKGVGANSHKEGTLTELIDLFEYDAATSTYSVTVATTRYGQTFEADFSITVKDGKVSKMVNSVTEEEDLSEEGMPGVTMEIGISQTAEYSDVGSLSVTIDEDYKDVEQENISVNHVVATEALWKELLTDFATTEFHISYYNNRTEMQYNYYVDLENNTAMSKEENWELGNRTYRYLRVEGDKIVTYSGYTTDGAPVTSLHNSSDTPKGEDVTATLIIALMADYVPDYYAGFDEGDLCNLFSKFEFTSLNRLEASLKLNGKDVTVNVWFNYDNYEEKFSVGGISVYYDEAYGTDSYFNVYGDAKSSLENMESLIVTD